MSSFHKAQLIKKLSPKDAPADIETKTELIGTKLAGSPNPAIVATAVGVSGASTQVHGAIAQATSTKNAAKSATSNLHSKTNTACEKANAAGIIVMQQMPNDPDGWVVLGFDVTDADVAATVVPGAVLHGSVSQGDTLGTADIHHDPLATADDYRVYATIGAPGDRTKYIDVTNTSESTSKSNTTVTLPADYLNVPLNFILVAHNTAGDGPDSVPFGGGRKIQ